MSQEVDQSRRRIVKAAYAAPTLAVLGMVTSMNASGSTTPPDPPPDQGQGAGEPDDYDLDAGNDCGRWLSPDCID